MARLAMVLFSYLRFLSIFLCSGVATAAYGAPPTLDAAIDLHLSGDLPAARDAYLDLLIANSGLAVDQEAQVRNNLCVLLPEIGQVQTAVQHCRSAVELRRAAQDPIRLARALNNLGIALLYSGRSGEAKTGFEQALQLNQQHGQWAASADNLTHLGLVAEAEGRLSDALDFHLRSQALAESHPDQPWSAARRQTAVINRGVTLEKLSQYRPALELYSELLTAADLEPRRLGRLLVNTAALYRNLDDVHRALGSLDQAQEIFNRIGDLAGRVDVGLIRGQVQHFNLGRPDQAELAYEQALELARVAGDSYGEVQALYLLGELLRQQGALERAKRMFELCLATTPEIGWPEPRWSAHAGLAEVFLQTSEFDAAIHHAELALEVVESVRQQVRNPQQRGSFFKNRRAIYSTAIEVLSRNETSGTEASWWVVQRAKERELSTALGLQATERLQATEPRQPVLDVEALLSQLATRGLADYWLDEHRLYVWVLPPQPEGHRDLSRLTLTRFEQGDRWRRAVIRTHQGLSSRAPAEADDLAELGRILLGPLGIEPGSEWLLVTDGSLRYLPFEVLPLPGAEPGPGAKLLIDSARISYLPSAATLVALGRPAGAQRAYDFIGLGDSITSTAGRSWLGGTELVRLPAAQLELKSAAAQWPGPVSLAMGEAASESFLRDRLAKGTAVLHLATHAVVEEPPGRGAALLLSAPPGEVRPSWDGLLRPPEIAELPGDPDLTVLAACRSAVSEDGDVGALGSLTGAFLASGSRGVLASLWPVGDQTSAIVLERFYTRLRDGVTPTRALADVKRELRADPRWNHEFLWAGWVLWGDPPPLAPAANRYAVYDWSVMLALIGLMAGGWTLSRRGRRT